MLLPACVCVWLSVCGLDALTEICQISAKFYINSDLKINDAIYWQLLIAMIRKNHQTHLINNRHYLQPFSQLWVCRLQLRRRCHFVAAVGVAAGGFVSVLALFLSPSLSCLLYTSLFLSLFCCLSCALRCLSTFFPCVLHLSFYALCCHSYAPCLVSSFFYKCVYMHAHACVLCERASTSASLCSVWVCCLCDCCLVRSSCLTWLIFHCRCVLSLFEHSTPDYTCQHVCTWTCSLKISLPNAYSLLYWVAFTFLEFE